MRKPVKMHAEFTAPPSPNARLDLRVANTDLSQLQGPLFAHVWVNQARGPLARRVPVDPAGRVSFETYPDVVTSIKFHDASGRWEKIERHTIRLTTTDARPAGTWCWSVRLCWSGHRPPTWWLIRHS